MLPSWTSTASGRGGVSLMPPSILPRIRHDGSLDRRSPAFRPGGRGHTPGPAHQCCVYEESLPGNHHGDINALEHREIVRPVTEPHCDMVWRVRSVQEGQEDHGEPLGIPPGQVVEPTPAREGELSSPGLRREPLNLLRVQVGHEGLIVQPGLGPAGRLEIEPREERHLFRPHLGEATEIEARNAPDVAEGLGESRIGEPEFYQPVHPGGAKEGVANREVTLRDEDRSAVLHDERISEPEEFPVKLHLRFSFGGAEHHRDSLPPEVLERGASRFELVALPVQETAVKVAIDHELVTLHEHPPPGCYLLSFSTTSRSRSNRSGIAANTRFQAGIRGNPTGSARYSSEARPTARAKASTARPSSC